jgi:hypothetical protein
MSTTAKCQVTKYKVQSTEKLLKQVRWVGLNIFNLSYPLGQNYVHYQSCKIFRFSEKGGICVLLIFWFYLLIQSFDSIFWFNLLIQSSDSIFWFNLLIQSSDSIFWFNLLIQSSDLIFWNSTQQPQLEKKYLRPIRRLFCSQIHVNLIFSFKNSWKMDSNCQCYVNQIMSFTKMSKQIHFWSLEQSLPRLELNWM